jgi:hypothetical protein
MPTTWTVKNSNGELLPCFIADTPRQVGCKIVRNRYDAFRIEVSTSYRELFERELNNVLAQQGWRIVPLKKRRNRGHADVQTNVVA